MFLVWRGTVSLFHKWIPNCHSIICWRDCSLPIKLSWHPYQKSTIWLQMYRFIYWDCNSISLIRMSILVLFRLLWLCSNWIWNRIMSQTTLFLFTKLVLAILTLLYSRTTLSIYYSKSGKIVFGIFNKDYAKFVDQFKECCHLNILSCA